MPIRSLYLCYFGTADPAFYGIQHINLPGGYYLNTRAEMPSGRSVVAVSATKLQGIYVYPDVLPFSNIPAWLPPFLLQPGSAMTLA